MRDYIKKHFGSQKQCAEELGVTEQTVSNWMKRNPRGILKHANADRDWETVMMDEFFARPENRRARRRLIEKLRRHGPSGCVPFEV
jgi:transcriptional regulator with XRE-family HTH domain